MVKSSKGIVNSILIGIIVLLIGAFFAVFLTTQVGAEEKISVEIPKEDLTTYIYTGEEQVYQISSSEYYEITNNKRTNAGKQTVTVSLIDKENTAWSDGTTEDKTYSFIINRAHYTQLYDMTGVMFESKEVIEDGKTHTLEITGELPEGIYASYTANIFSEPGEYQVIVSFGGGNENYTSIPSKVAVLSIRKKSLSAMIEGHEKDTIIITSEKGIRPTYDNLLIGEVDLSENESILNSLLENETVFVSYDVKLAANKIFVQPDNKVRVQLLIPKELREQEIRILRLTDDGRVVDMEASIEDGYAVFETEILAKFVITHQVEESNVWVWILVAIIAVFVAVGVIVVVLIKIARRESKETGENSSIKNEPKKKN